MQIFRSRDTIPDAFKNAVIGIGKFDGIHIGHQEIIRTCKSLAKDYKTKSIILTFDPYPGEVLSGENNYKSIISLENKLKLIELSGIDAVIIEDFTKELSSTKATKFIEDYLLVKYQVGHVVTGHNFFFGHKESGNSALLSEYAGRYNFKYTQINRIVSEFQEVSGTRIKELFSQGRIISANKLLGRRYNIEGFVMEGKKVAKKILSAPTANIAINKSLHLPLYGVYIVRINIKNSEFYGVANLGSKPTVNSGSDSEPALEINIFDFDENIYGEYISADILAFLRPERKFKDLLALKFQIERDISASKYYLNRGLDVYK